MRWITQQHAARSADPSSVLPDAKSVICVGMRYWDGLRPTDTPNTGRIARYSWGRDYHAVLGKRLEEFTRKLAEEVGGSHKWYVDTGPLMDKALASRAGLGWYGKNTNILSTEFGSWILLGEIVTTLEIEADRPLQRDCGGCRLCVVACPTGALGPDYSIDSRKCISYLTIEHREPIPVEYRPLIGSWVFGCDICQDVCPPSMEPHLKSSRDRHAWAAEVKSYVKGGDPISTPSSDAHVGSGAPTDLRSGVDLVWLLRMTHEEYLKTFRDSSIRRAKPWMLRRNAAVCLGNVGTRMADEPLIQALEEDEEPVVRGHAAWSLGRLANRKVTPLPVAALVSALSKERDPLVREEIRAVLPG